MLYISIKIAVGLVYTFIDFKGNIISNILLFRIKIIYIIKKTKP